MNKRFVLFLAMMGTVAVWGQQAQRRPGLLNRLGARNAPSPAAEPSAANEAAQEAIKNAPRGTNGVPALVFDKAPLDLVLKAYGEQVKKTIIPAPDLPKADITLKSLEGQLLTQEEYLEAIEVVLSMNGVVLEPRGSKFLRALARKTVRTQGIPILMKHKGALPEQGRVVSQMITLENIEAAEAQKALEGFKDPNGLFQVFERTNAILVTDTQENINRMLEIVRAIDVASPVQEDVFTVQIKYALAADIKKALETIVTESQKEQPKETVTTKTSGTPGFTRNQPTPMTRLLNNRLGRPNPPEPPKPNETLMASVSDADRGMIRGKVLILDDERSNKLIIITSKTNMKFFDKVIETLDVETTPDVQIKVFRLCYADCEEVASMLNDLIGNASSASQQGKGNQNTSASARAGGSRNITSGTATQQRPRTHTSSGSLNTSKVGELNKDNCKVLADKRINGVVVYARTQDMGTLKKIIDEMDIKLSQVLIETMILQVQLSDEISTGIDWVAGLGRRGKRSSLDGGSGGTSLPVGALSDEVQKGAGGLNYYAVSKALDIGAIVNASKSDSRTKLVASPIIMTVDNKEATIEATRMRYLLKGYTYSGSTYNGSAVPDYEQKEIGLTVKVTPKINPNGTVMLTVEEEFSAIGDSQTIQAATGGTTNINGSTQQAISGISVETTVTRKLSADITVDNRQTVILGGLTQTETKREDAGIPILKDIPYIGRYLFGKTRDVESRQELIMFLTPYVLDDEESAMAEARRRKNTMSDSRPWDDHGWSASELADPVSKKEQLRRFKEEWARQNSERESKLEIEKAKLERAKKLEKMDEKERAFWLKLHQKELEAEKERESEKDLADQSVLKDLAAELREKHKPKKEEGPAASGTVEGAGK